ncbi:MAG: phenylalanine--tRNA ligase subunit beta [Rhodospirillales bacterium]
MKFTLSWLKEHLATDASAAELAERLTMIGHELESLTDRAAGLRDFIVAEVVACEPHPNADKLRVCIVDTGAKRLQVVCGAPNARTGLKGVFAAVGTTIPASGTVLKAAAIRGVESNGMLLSEREMGLSDEHTGIVELPADALTGAPAAAVLGVDDPLFDVGITPNRGDCFGVRGLARDLAAAGLGTLKPLPQRGIHGGFASPVAVVLDFDEATHAACPYFAGRLIRGLVNRESPRWLQDRLVSIGLRPISALVDITNYLTFDVCRPLHAFDADRLAGDLRVRLALDGERLAALDGREYALTPGMTVIADDRGPQALGGVIGGEPTACTAATTSVFLESALFDPARTANTGRSLGILSDARFRFERGIDPAFVVDGLDLATRLVLDICDGEASEVVVAGAPPPQRPPIRFRPERVTSLTGAEVSAGESADILRRLGFSFDQGETAWQVSPPPWRGDVESEACVIEEIVRIAGYDRIPVTPLSRDRPFPEPVLNPLQRRRALARRFLAGRGMMEAVTFSFLAPSAAEAFGGGGSELSLVNPISADLAVMRPSLLPNLIAAVGRNGDRGLRDVALFEVGPQYRGDRPEDQSIVAAGVRAGRAAARSWADRGRPVDAFDAKADALALLTALAAPVTKLQLDTAAAPAWYHPGRSAVLRLGPRQPLALFGEIHPGVLKELGIKVPVVAFEVFCDAIPAPRSTGPARPPLALSAYQPVERDFAFIVDVGVPAAAVLDAVRGAEKTLITDAILFDVFTGDAIGPGKKSLAVTVVLQPVERTLTDADIEAIATRIVNAVAKATGATLRG